MCCNPTWRAGHHAIGAAHRSQQMLVVVVLEVMAVAVGATVVEEEAGALQCPKKAALEIGHAPAVATCALQAGLPQYQLGRPCPKSNLAGSAPMSTWQAARLNKQLGRPQLQHCLPLRRLSLSFLAPHSASIAAAAARPVCHTRTFKSCGG